MKQLKALSDKVVIKVEEEGDKTYGSIIIPDLGKEKPLMGVVVNVGPGRHTEMGTILPMTVKEGDVVLVPKFSSQTVQVDGEEFVVCREFDILATIEEK
jgi:chaperonin GroES